MKTNFNKSAYECLKGFLIDEVLHHFAFHHELDESETAQKETKTICLESRHM